MVVIEGIHGLNGRLTAGIAERFKFKIFVSAILQIRNHKGHFLHSTDHRFIRRIVRDSNYRGYDAETTIARWPSVTRGERKNIFPFQDEAHFVFNSSLLYEYPVLKRFAFDLLVEINKKKKVFFEARKLLSVLNYFDFAPESSLQLIPKDSVLREFIGGSRYEY
jgi:uridine kinase